MSLAPLCSMRAGVRFVRSISALATALTSCSRTESPPSSSSASAVASPGPSAAASNGSSQASSSAPQREKIDCAHFLSMTAESSNKLKIPMWTEPGSWGGLSSDLQRLPAGVELCGATHLGEPKDKASFTTVFFRSPLYGDDFKKFWTPIFTAAGCSLLKDGSIDGRTELVWSCPGKGGTVTVATALRYEAYSIGFMKR